MNNRSFQDKQNEFGSRDLHTVKTIGLRYLRYFGACAHMRFP